MPDDSDYIRLRGHINRLKSEFAALDPDLIERICQNLIVVRRSRPTFKKLRAYVVELTTDHDEPTLRGLLGLPPKTSARATDGARRTARPAAGGGDQAPRQRRPGRPRGTRSVPREQIIEVYRTLRRSYGRPPTQGELASNLSPRVATRTLQAHLAAYGLPWPIE